MEKKINALLTVTAKSLIVLFVILAVIISPFPVFGSDLFGEEYAKNIGLGERDPVKATILIIKWILAFLGLLLVILIIYAGLKWMTAMGNDEKVKDSKKIIVNAVIGLIIVLAAYGIADWILTKALSVTSAASQLGRALIFQKI